ncbi:uncharacterized protein V3H82_022341 [Fundulus diaphanus]
MEAYLWIVSFMIFPHLNLGLLSDHKICGDPECESPMSRVQATKNHQGKDCRFLNFRRGDTIFVYHKLTGKREDLWAGSIDKQFGYFPKDAVQEEEVFTTTRKVLETQKSDFFCMDASGYPIDTTHLDTDEDDNHDIQMQEPESIQISPHSLDTKAQGSLTSTESMVKEREAEDGNKDLMDGAQLLKDGLKASATPEEQGGSPSSWMHSSVTGWLGFGKEEQSGDSEQGVREDEKEEPKSEASLTSSVTDWLGFGGEGEKDNDEDTIKIREESFTSTMTGWLGFGEKKTVTVENEEDEETGNEKEPTEKFRSRRMSLDLEGSKLQEEEKEDMGTLGWLGSGLSSRLGFGSSAQDSGNGEGVKEEPASSSWIEMTISKGFGFRDSNTEPEENKESGISETEKDPTLEQPDGSENIHISQSQTSFSEEIKAKNEKESQMKELVNVSSSPPAREGRGLTEERPKEVVELEEGEKSEIVSLDHEEAGVERLKESEEPNEKKQEKQEKMADVSGESSSEEFRDESQKDLKTLNVEEKQVEELLECGNQIRMKDLKESEEQNKKEEKAEFSVEAEREIVVDKQKGEENQITKLPEREQATLERSEKSNMPNEKKEAKEKKVKVFGESNRDEGKELIEKMQKEDNEPKEKEKSVKELVEDGNQVRVEDVKKDEKQVQEEQLEHKKTDIWRPEVDHFERQMLENSTLASLVSETNAQTEVQKKEDEEKEKKVEMADKEELEKEKQHLMKEVEDDNVDNQTPPQIYFTVK